MQAVLNDLALATNRETRKKKSRKQLHLNFRDQITRQSTQLASLPWNGAFKITFGHLLL